MFEIVIHYSYVWNLSREAELSGKREYSRPEIAYPVLQYLLLLLSTQSISVLASATGAVESPNNESHSKAGSNAHKYVAIC
jgi:hypothetical protein